MVVNPSNNTTEGEGEDYDCTTLESSLSSLLGFLDPASREQARAMVSDDGQGSLVGDAPVFELDSAGKQPLFADEAAVQVPRAASPFEVAAKIKAVSLGGSEPAGGGEVANLGPAGLKADAGEEQQSSATKLPPPSSSQLFSDEVVAASKRTSSSSFSSDGAGSSSTVTGNVAPDLGGKVADICRATVRDMLKDVLLETLPMQDAVEVLFKMDSHGGWSNIRGGTSSIIAAAMRPDADAAAVVEAAAAAAAAAAAMPSPYRGSASLPATPGRSSAGQHAGVLSLTPPPPPPPSALLLSAHLAVAARGPPPPPPPPPPPGGAGSPTSSATGLAPLTPARSAPGAIPLPAFGSVGGGVGSPAPVEMGAASSGASSPLASGPGGIGGGGGATATATGGSAMLFNMLQQHPALVDTFQQHPQLLSAILNAPVGAVGAAGTAAGGGMVSAEGLAAAMAAAAAGAGSAAGGGAGGGFQPYDDGGAAGVGGYGGVLAGLPQLGSPLAAGMHSPPAMSSPARVGAGIWGPPLPTHGSPIHGGGGGGAFGSPQPHHGGGGGGLEAFHALMGGGGGHGSAGLHPLLQGIDPTAVGYSCKNFEELHPAVRDKIQSVLDTCKPHIRAEHFDAGVRHWLLQLQMLFGEMCAVSALHAIETAANLEGVRRMKAFITTRLIDHYEQMVWSQDPQGYAMRKLTPDLISVLEELVHSDKGLRWTHFDPKVLDTIREIRTPDAVRTRLSKLCAQELNGVQNVPAYLYTLLSKRGKTAKQAAAQKQMQELALRLAAAQSAAAVHGGHAVHGAPPLHGGMHVFAGMHGVVPALAGVGLGGGGGGASSGLGPFGGLAAMGLGGGGGAAGAAVGMPYGGMQYGGGAVGLGPLGSFGMFGM